MCFPPGGVRRPCGAYMSGSLAVVQVWSKNHLIRTVARAREGRVRSPIGVEVIDGYRLLGSATTRDEELGHQYGREGRPLGRLEILEIAKPGSEGVATRPRIGNKCG